VQQTDRRPSQRSSNPVFRQPAVCIASTHKMGFHDARAPSVWPTFPWNADGGQASPKTFAQGGGFHCVIEWRAGAHGIDVNPISSGQLADRAHGGRSDHSMTQWNPPPCATSSERLPTRQRFKECWATTLGAAGVVETIVRAGDARRWLPEHRFEDRCRGRADQFAARGRAASRMIMR